MKKETKAGIIASIGLFTISFGRDVAVNLASDCVKDGLHLAYQELSKPAEPLPTSKQESSDLSDYDVLLNLATTTPPPVANNYTHRDGNWYSL